MMEVVDLPLFDAQLNDSVVMKMSFQHVKCDTLGVHVRRDCCEMSLSGC